MTNETIDTYKSIKSKTEGLFKDNGSRFIAYCYPVENEEEVKELVSNLKKEHYNARHHCYSYRIGAKGKNFRMNDDGEPSYTAGRPILGQIDSYGLSDILIVVVRYFGGIKLGVPGLIRAYKQASLDALEKATIVEKIVKERYLIDFDYSAMNDIMTLIKDYNLDYKNPIFELNCSLEIELRLSIKETFIEKLEKIQDCKFKQI